ncbi:unnamed protein product, partial [Phaeothamnion confervicola]
QVEGVALYLSDFSRPLTERLQKDFFSDPSTASMTCARTGPMSVADGTSTSKGGEEILTEARSLFFKTIKVRRLYDKDAGTVVYVAYSDKFDARADDNKSRFKSSLCALHVD